MKEHLDDLKQIRQLMERSTKFLSLSGLSGIVIGIFALIGAWAVFGELATFGINSEAQLTFEAGSNCLKIAGITLFSSILAAAYFTFSKARKNGKSLLSTVSGKVFLVFGLPLFLGGLFGLAAILHQAYWALAGIMLVFYALALLNVSQFTYPDIYYLGISEAFLGIMALFLVEYSLIFWAIGFGVLHILYGIIMFKKYDN